MPHVVLFCTEVWPQITRKEGVAGVDENVEIPCVLPTDRVETLSSDVLWMINDSVYGFLHIPREFRVCGETCDLITLTIPVLQGEMNGTVFQCVSIDYATNMTFLGGITELYVSPTPPFLHGM